MKLIKSYVELNLGCLKFWWVRQGGGLSVLRPVVLNLGFTQEIHLLSSTVLGTRYQILYTTKIDRYKFQNVVQLPFKM
jgi:hypothetical protein